MTGGLAGLGVRPGTELAVINWEASIAALYTGECPGSSGEEKILRVAASLAAEIPVRLGDAIISLDDDNVALVVKALLHASGQRQFPQLRE